MPTWMMGLAFFVGFAVLLGLVYYGVQSFGHSSGSAPAEKTSAVAAPAAGAQQNTTNPLQKYIEVVGFRLTTKDKKPVVKFVAVNHSGGDIVDLEANVSLWASTKRSEEDSVGTFSFKAKNLAAGSSEEFTAPLQTKLKGYELPDWQSLLADVQVVSPQP